MNVAYFITPKNEIVTLNSKMTIKQAMDKMAKYKYSAVPVLNELGQYLFTLSEGDLLWHIATHSYKHFKDIEKNLICNIKRDRQLSAVSINASIDSLIDCAVNQGFVPVVDDTNTFIGIIKRSDIINYTVGKMGYETSKVYKESVTA